MDKETFLNLLRDKLTEFGAGEENTNKYIKQFERYFNTMTDDEVIEQIDNFDSLDIIAQNIMNLIKKKQDTANKTASSISQDETTAETVMQLKNEIIGNTRVKTTDKTLPAENNDHQIIQDDTNKEKQTEKIPKIIPQRTGHLNTLPLKQDKTPAPAVNINELDESYIHDTAIPYTTLFWVVLILTMPLTVPLIITVLLLFISTFAILMLSIVALLAVLVVIVIAGTGISLIGIIYGITQSFSLLPVGLFEIGFGVVIGGSAMLSGILIYNTAIRFLPFVIRYLFVFFKYTLLKTKVLINFIKRECAKQ